MTGKNFWLMSSSLLSNEDTKTLSLLYQPLIGPSSLGTYLLMANIINPLNLQTEVYSFQYLLDLLNITNKQLKDNINKLEAIGLLTTFINGDIYLYRINMPLKARQFFLDTILGPYLKSEIGENNFDELFSYFSVPEFSRKGYKNITKSFDDVYEVKKLDLLSSDRFVFGRKNGSGIVIKDSFDFDSFFEILPVRLKKKRLYTKKVINQIASVIYVYNFNEREIIKILSLAYDDETNKIFTEKIPVLATDLFNRNYSESEISISRQPDEDFEYDLSLLNPQDILKVFGSKMTNQSTSLETMRSFFNRNAYDIGLLNGVILMSMRYVDDFPPLAYLEKVLADWLKKGIKTSEDAMMILQNAEKQPKRKPKRKTQRVDDDEPEWLDDIIDSFWKMEDDE